MLMTGASLHSELNQHTAECPAVDIARSSSWRGDFQLPCFSQDAYPVFAGTVFMFDSVIADTRQLQQQAWRQLAKEENLPFPAEPRHLYDMRAERVITEVLAAHWP